MLHFNKIFSSIVFGLFLALILPAVLAVPLILVTLIILSLIILHSTNDELKRIIDENEKHENENDLYF